jgi:hypothetical protein
MFSKFLVGFFGLFIFLFLFWKRLKEDYASSIIFTSAFYMILGVFAGSIISDRFFPAWWFWADFLGIILFLFLGIFRFKLRVFETLEAAVISFLPWLSFVFLEDSIKKTSTQSLFGFLGILFLISIFFLLDKSYKRFTWYKSGRVGFSGMTTLGTFFLTRALVASFVPNMLSLVGKFESILSAMLAFFAYLMVFNLARETS